MSHRFEILRDYSEQKKHLEPIVKKLGKELPAKDCAIAFTEFDECGEVVAFLMLQNKLFAEGLYAKDGTANIRTLWNMLGDEMRERFHGKDLLVMASSKKMASVCKRFKCKDLFWRVFRREF